ncbi:MAG: polymer-forming cytoskeletal protein [Ruminococcus sp.]|nr:polymer-forming cytoskeletal protein [Ruminococcus sp.]
MVKKEDNRKLRGSVLLTVVCVMSLLIVFLFGTLTLATAANNRAHVNYSSAQTDVTSRIVVDSAIRAISANNEYGSFIGNIGEDGKETVNVTLGNGVPNRGRYGDIAPVSVEWAGTKDFYDPVNNKWTNGGVLKFTSTVSMGGVDSTTSAYVVKQPAGTSSSGKGAGFVTVAGANLETQSSLFGGSYINVPTADMILDLDYTYRDEAYQAAHWNPKEVDKCDLTYYRHFAPFDKGNLGTTSFKLYNSDAHAEADLFVNNNMYIENWSGFVFPDSGTGISVWGDLVFNNSTSYSSTKVKSSANPTDALKFNEIPYIYVDGKIGSLNHIILGDTANPFPLNIFCGSIDTTNNLNGGGLNTYSIAGDLYCMNPAETSYLGGQNSSELYKWTLSVVTQTDNIGYVTGSVCSKGDIVVKNMTIHGNLRVEGNLTLPNQDNNQVTVDGDVYVGKNLTIEGDNTKLNVTGNIYCHCEKYEKVDTIDIGSADMRNVPKIDGNDSGMEMKDLITQHPDYGYTNTSEYVIYNTATGKVAPADTPLDKDDDLLVVPDKWRNDNKDKIMPLEGKDSGGNTYDYSKIYPEYATRETILNLKEKDGKLVPDDEEHPDTQIVKTFDQILASAANPFKTLPNGVTDAIVKYKNNTLPVCNSFADILKLSKKYLPSIGEDGSYQESDVVTLADTAGWTDNEWTNEASKYSKDQHVFIIEEDCALNISQLQNCHILIKPPKDTTLNIIIKKLSADNGSIILDDTSGNNAVNIYVAEQSDSEKNNANFELKSSSLLTTTKYMKFFYDCKNAGGGSIGYGSTLADFNLEDVGRPNINVYGGKNSYMYTNGLPYIAANITSEHLKFGCGGQEEIKTHLHNNCNITDIYYNNFKLKLKKGNVFGCLNAKEVEAGNLFNVIYVTDSAKTPPAPTTAEFDYRVLYYDEY